MLRREEQPTAEVAQGKAKGGDGIHLFLRSDIDDQGVIKDISTREADCGKYVQGNGRFPVSRGHEGEGAGHDNAHGGEVEQEFLAGAGSIGDRSQNGSQESDNDACS